MRRTCEDIPPLEKLKLPGFDLDLDYYFQHKFDEIGQASQELPIVLEYISGKLQDLIESKLIKKQKVKEVEAAVYFSLKGGDYVAKGYGTKVSDKALERALVLDDDVKKVHREYAVLVGWVGRFQNLQGNIQAKLDMLRSYEATRRKLVDDDIPD